jgi:hypothetical protein
MKNYALLMPFLDGSQSFCNGFAVGLMWERMTKSESFKNHSVYKGNKEQVDLMCEHFGYEWEFKEYNEEWLILNASPIDISGATNLAP